MSSQGRTSSGLEPNVAAALAYVLGWITGLIFFLIEPENKYVRFHALQSIFFSVFVSVIYAGLGLFLAVFTVIPGIGLIFGFLGTLVYVLLAVGVFVFWIMLIIRAYQGDKWKLPVVGDLADQNS